MNTQNESLVELIHDAAGQVGPVAGIDGETMARRAIRRERIRRGVMGGVATLAVVALATLGGLVATGKQVLPAGWPFGDGWKEVTGGGLSLSVPEDFERYDQGEGYPSWGSDGQDGPFDAAEVTSAVTVVPLDAGEPLTDAGDELVETDVPGAVSARYLFVDEGWDGDPQGVLEVELESGRAVQVHVVLPDAPGSTRLFERLVESVRVDPGGTEADLEIQGPELEVVGEHPADWAVQEHQGLRFAMPGDWVEDDLSAAREDGWPTVSMNGADGELRLQVTTFGVTYEEPGSTYTMALPAGADVAGAELDPQDGTLHAELEVRRAEGRTYVIDVYVPEGADGDRIVSTVAGSLEFTAEADDLPTYEDLRDGQALVDDAPPVPQDWVVVSDVADLPDLRLRIPADWADQSEGDGTLVREAPSDEYEGVSASVEEAGILGNGGIPVGGYRIDVPGAERATVRMTDYTAYGEEEAAAFNARVEVELPDGRFVQLMYDGPPGSDGRFWQLLGTLAVGTD